MEIKLLSLLKSEEKKLLKVETFSKNQTIFFEGDECEEISILVSGEIQIISNTLDGRSIIYRKLKQGEVFGNNLLFSSDNCYKGDVVAVSESTLCFINKENLIKLLKTNDDFLYEYFRIQSDFGKELNGLIKVLTSKTSEEKVINYLKINGGKALIKSVTTFASELNMSRENLSRILSKMIKEKKIFKKGKLYYLN